MSSGSELQYLKRYFERESLHVSDYWLQCCLEWFKNEFRNYTNDFMCKTVKQQWLDSDLCDIEVQSLPINLSQQKKTIVNGTYAVQVMYTKDISKSSYSQLKTIRDMYKLTRTYTDNENEITETGRRTLSLYMTDGVQFINGFEYEYIPCLNLHQTPGIKILLIGPLSIRNGEILLKKNNVKVIGGEVESIKIINAVENVLARELNMPENPNPKFTEAEYTCTINNSNNTTNSIINSLKIPTSNNKISNFNVRPTYEQHQQQIKPPAQNVNTHTQDLNVDNDFFANLDTQCFEFEQEEENIRRLQNSDNITNNKEMHLEEALFDDDDFDFNTNDEECLMEKFENDIKVKEKRILSIVDSSEPFVYIKQLLDNSIKVSRKIYKVRAWFVKNIEKLKLDKHKGWSMTFEIEDSTGSIIANFLSEIIEELMELSPTEALQEKRQHINKNIESLEKLTAALEKCKDKLESYEYIIHLEFNEHSKPTIVALKNIDRQDIEKLTQRVLHVNPKV